MIDRGLLCFQRVCIRSEKGCKARLNINIRQRSDGLCNLVSIVALRFGVAISLAVGCCSARRVDRLLTAALCFGVAISLTSGCCSARRVGRLLSALTAALASTLTVLTLSTILSVVVLVFIVVIRQCDRADRERHDYRYDRGEISLRSSMRALRVFFLMIFLHLIISFNDDFVRISPDTIFYVSFAGKWGVSTQKRR